MQEGRKGGEFKDKMDLVKRELVRGVGGTEGRREVRWRLVTKEEWVEGGEGG